MNMKLKAKCGHWVVADYHTIVVERCNDCHIKALRSALKDMYDDVALMVEHKYIDNVLDDIIYVTAYKLIQDGEK